MSLINIEFTMHFSLILANFKENMMILKIQNRKIIFSVRKKFTPTKKSLKIDRTPNLDTPRYRVYCLTPPELGDRRRKNVLFSVLVTAMRWTFNKFPEQPFITK